MERMNLPHVLRKPRARAIAILACIFVAEAYVFATLAAKIANPSGGLVPTNLNLLASNLRGKVGNGTISFRLLLVGPDKLRKSGLSSS